MPLDEDIAKVLANGDGRLRLPTGDPAEARTMFERICAATKRYADPIEVAAVEDIEIDGPADPLRGRVYRPDATAPTATLVFFHGGGWVIGSIESHDLQARMLCRDAEVTVLSVEYRLAPENKWPAGLEDALAATRWAAANIDALGGEPPKLAVGGDSAGGNFAAVVAQELRGSEIELAAQILIYPSTDFTGDYPSRTENADGYYLTRDEVEFFGRAYLEDTKAAFDPRVSPLLADDLSGLPPAVVVTAEFDPLRDEGNAYALALQEAGVDVRHCCYGGMVHGFFGWGPVSSGAAQANFQICQDVAAVLGRPA